MKKKDLKELKTKDVKELSGKVKEYKKELMKGNLELKMDKIKNLHFAQNKRRDIAQIQTIIRMKQIAEENSGDKEEKGEKPHVAN